MWLQVICTLASGGDGSVKEAEQFRKCVTSSQFELLLTMEKKNMLRNVSIASSLITLRPMH